MYRNRVQQIRTEFQKKGVDAFFISSYLSILYLAGIQTLSPEEREAFLLITPKDLFVFTDGRYLDEVLLKQIADIGGELKLIETGKGLTYHLDELTRQGKIRKLGFEEEDLKYSEFSLLQKKVRVELAPLLTIVGDLRQVKTKGEVDLIEKACEVTDTCLEELVPVIKIGMSEKELAWKMEVWIREHGYELAFEPIIAVDQNSAIPHYNTKTGNGVIKDGSVLLIDYGVRYKNYNADSTRMIFIGKQSDEVYTTYEVVSAAQEKTIKFVQKGKELQDIDLFCRAELQKSRVPDYMHSTGHGIGLEVHESPRISKNVTDTLQPSQIFTIEPGVYYPGKYGMRVEDTVLVTDTFQALPLTRFSKKFLQI